MAGVKRDMYTYIKSLQARFMGQAGTDRDKGGHHVISTSRVMGQAQAQSDKQTKKGGDRHRRRAIIFPFMRRSMAPSVLSDGEKLTSINHGRRAASTRTSKPNSWKQHWGLPRSQSSFSCSAEAGWEG